MLLSKVSLGQCPGFDERAGKSGEVTPGPARCGRSDCAARGQPRKQGSYGRKECESGRSLLFKHSGNQRRGFLFSKDDLSC